VSVSDWVTLVPVTTFPKLMLEGLAVSLPGVTPAPDRGMLLVDTLVTSAMFPLELPVDAGLNVTVNVALCEGASVIGKERPLTVKPLPVTVAWAIVRFDPPTLLSVSERV